MSIMRGQWTAFFAGSEPKEVASVFLGNKLELNPHLEHVNIIEQLVIDRG